MNRLISLLLSLFIALPAHAAGPVIWGPGGAQNISSGPVYDSSIPYIKQPQTNYIANQSGVIDTTGWGVSGAVTVTRVTSSLPRATTVGTGLSLAAGSANDYAQYCWTIDDADINTKMQWSWSQAPGSYADGDFDAQVYSFTSASCGGSATELALSTDNSSGDTEIPNYDGSYYTTFDTTDALYYGIRYVRKAGTSTLVLSNVMVGPGNIVAVPPVGEIVTPTITWNNSTGLTPSNNLTFDRVGENLIINGFVTFTGTGSSGSALTLSLSGLTPTSTTSGSVRMEETTTGYSKSYTALAGSNVLTFYTQNNGSVASTTVKGTDVGGSTSGDINAMYFNGVTVRIAEWAGAPNYAGSNDVVYAWNSSTSTSTETTAFAYGPGGVAFVNYAPAGTTAVTKRVRLLSTPMPGDLIVLEINDGSGWAPLDQRSFGFLSNDAGTTYTGAVLAYSSGLDYDVRFYSAAIPGVAWSAISSFKWRVAHYKGGAPVAFSSATSTSLGLVKAMPVTTFSVSITGPVSTSGTFRASRSGDVVTIQWPQLLANGASSASAITVDFTNMPSWARPRVDLSCMVFTRDATVYNSSPSQFVIPTSGNGTVNESYASSAFSSNATTTGMETGSCTYNGAAW